MANIPGQRLATRALKEGPFAFDILGVVFAAATLYVAIASIFIMVWLYWRKTQRRRNPHQWAYELESTYHNVCDRGSTAVAE